MYANNIPVEREFTLDEAIRFGLREISKIPHSFELTTVGSIYAASVCHLKDTQNKTIIESCGKGGWINSQVGAIYEIIQDFYAANLDEKFFDAEAKIYYESSKRISEQESLHADLAINILNKLQDQKIPYRNYQNITRNKTIKVPLFISNVKIASDDETKYMFSDSSILKRYSSDNGHAAGLTTEEALLHSINECIERDSFAMLLYRCFFLNVQQPLIIINKSSLPQELLNNIIEVESVIGCEVILIDMTNNINVTSIICIATNE